MYTKHEASQIKQEFWTAFGQYMSPVLSFEGEKVNWINYKTGIKDVYFRMDADKRTATISIEISHKEPGIQELYFEQFAELKKLLENTLGEEWHWQLHAMNEYGKVTSRIFTQIEGVNIFNKETWPALISFFKPRIIALDEFWSNARYGFEALS